MNVLSLCSGIGGLDLGVRIACPAAQTVCWVENDGYCQRVLVARMSDGSVDCAPVHGDLTRFDGRPWRGCVDLVTAGFPCQDISNAGRREGIREGNRSGLWFEVARVVREVGPRYVFLENVAALLNRGLDRVLGDLADLGFAAEWLCVSAADVGAPHLRKRVFILGVADAVQAGPEAKAERRRECDRRGGEVGHVPDPVCRTALADATGEYGTWPVASGDRRGEPASKAGDGSRSLADAQRAERGPDALSRGRGSEGSDGEGEAAGRAGERRFAVGYAESFAPWRQGSDEPEKRQDYRATVSLFPPGPADRTGWAAVLAKRPDLAPAVKRGVRGVDVRFAHRVERLKALGNSVVALQAALAFTVLAERLIDAD